MKRLGILALALVALAGFAAVAALPTPAARFLARAAATLGTTTASTTTAPGTTTGATTTATTATIPVEPKPSPPGKTPRLESKFPAAGVLVVSRIAVRRTPSPHGRVIKVMHYFRPDYRVQEIFAVGKKTGTDHQVWYRISIPMRPNGTYGWIPASTVSLAATTGQIVVHIGARTIDVYQHGKHVWHATVAVGAPGMQTPRGHFYVAARFVPYHDPFLGVFAVETSAYSRLTEWPGGGVVGIHGTDEPWLLGKAVSHGCVRVSNQTATKLRRYVPVGTPILIKG